MLLDTDIGSDIDDAVALAYLLRQPRCELLGITTVTGQAEARASLAQVLCEAAGRSVTVLPGAETPLIVESMQPQAPQAEKLDSLRRYDHGQAIPFLRDTIRAHPGEITLLAIGPLTNIALLFKSDPEIPGLLRQFIWMGGKYSDYPTPWGPTEWNAIVDPHATHIVLSTPLPDMTAYGLDITWQLSMTPAEVAEKFSTDSLLSIVLDWSEVWFRERELLHFHDPLAAVGIFHPDVCEYKRGKISVALDSAGPAGVTHYIDGAGPQRFARSVNPARFFRTFFQPFTG